MPRDRARLAAAFAFGALLLALSVVVAPQSRAAEPTYTGVVVSDEGGMQRTGSTVVLDEDPATITTWSDGWEIRVTAGAYRFRFSPGSSPYALGTFDTYGVSSSTDVGMRVEPTGSTPGGCGSGESGRFTLLELPEVDAGQHLTRFAADLVWRCIPYNANGDPARWLHASIRIGASTAPSIVTAPMTIAMGTTNVGATSTSSVTLATMGDGSTTLGAIDVEGPDAAMVAITNDQCSNATLATGSTCSFDVAFSPTSTQAKLAHIRIHGSSPAFDHLIRADGRGRSPLLDLPSELVVNGDEGGWVIDGAAYRFTGAEVSTPNGVNDERSAAVSFPGGNVVIAAPDPDVLAIGHYVIPPFDNQPIPGLGVSAFGHGCNWATGSFDVLEPPIYDTDGSLLSVAFDFVHHCEGKEPRVRGSVRLHTTLATIDLLPPTGEVVIEGFGGFVGDDTVDIDLPAEDASGVDQVRLSNDGVTWATRPYAATTSWSLTDAAYGGTPADGSKIVYVRWSDGAGNTSFGTTTSVILDTALPTVTAPRHGLTNSPVFDGTPSVRIVWSGADVGAGVARYDVQRSMDGGAWTSFSSGKYYAIEPRLASEHTYRFRVRAIDKAGNVSEWATGETFRLTRISESNARVQYAGTWTTQTSTSYWLGAAKRSGQAGARSTLAFTGKSVAWVATQGPNRGKAEVWVDGINAATVDLASTSALYRRVVWTKSWLTKGAHTVQIRVLGTAGRPYVDVDAFVVLE